MRLFGYMRQWSKKEFTRNSITLLSANTLAQLITFAVYPIITRLYSAQELGVLNLWLSIIGVLAIVSTGRYEPAIVMEKDDRGSSALIKLTLLINVSFLAVNQLIFTLFAHPIASCFTSPEAIEPWLPLIPVMVFLAGLWQTLNNYHIRHKHYWAIGGYHLTHSSLNAVFKVLFGHAGMLRSGLILSTLIAYGAALIVPISRIKFKVKEFLTYDGAAIKSMARKYANLPKFDIPRSVSNTLACNLPLLILPLSFGMDQIGLFSLALMIGFCPVNLYANSMMQVLYKTIVEKQQNQEKCIPFTARFCRRTALALLPFFVLFFFIAKWFFGFLFGADWMQAGIYFKMLLPWLFVLTMSSSLGFIPTLFFRQRTAMIIEFTYILLRVLALCIGIWLKDFSYAILLFGIVSAMMVSIQLVWYWTLLKNNEPCQK